MPHWDPVELFPAADVYVIGGGPSLRGFDWSLLRSKVTIGCNSAYTLGPDICGACFFMDKKFYDAFRDQLEAYHNLGGHVFTTLKVLASFKDAPFLKVVPRVHSGLHREALGCGGNSGCSAVNLALMLGARRVFLLGFDCKMPQGAQHWHDQYRGRIGESWTMRPALFPKFLEGWKDIAADLPNVFPGCEVINLGPDSAIPYFPKRDWNTQLAA